METILRTCVVLVGVAFVINGLYFAAFEWGPRLSLFFTTLDLLTLLAVGFGFTAVWANFTLGCLLAAVGTQTVNAPGKSGTKTSQRTSVGHGILMLATIAWLVWQLPLFDESLSDGLYTMVSITMSIIACLYIGCVLLVDSLVTPRKSPDPDEST